MPWDLIDPKVYVKKYRRMWGIGSYIPVQTTRGCPYRCTYCAVKQITGNGYRKKSVETVINELRHLRDNFGIEAVCFIDDNFTWDRDFVLSLCREIIDQNLGIKWDTPSGIRLDSLDEELLVTMEKSGCVSICATIESGSERMLEAMKRKMSFRTAREKVNLVKRVTNIEVAGAFILGHPDETEDDILETIEASLKLPLDLAFFFVYTPLPGTELAKALEEVSPGFFSRIDWESLTFDRISEMPRRVPSDRLKKLARQANLRFYSRPRVLNYVFQKYRRMGTLKTAALFLERSHRVWSRL